MNVDFSGSLVNSALENALHGFEETLDIRSTELMHYFIHVRPTRPGPESTRSKMHIFITICLM